MKFENYPLKITDTEWSDSYDILKNGDLVVSWNQKDNCVTKIFSDNKEKSLITSDYNQIKPKASKKFVAFYIEEKEGFKLCTYDLIEEKTYFPLKNVSSKPYEFVNTEDSIITTSINDSGDLVLINVHYKGNEKKIISQLPNSHYWFDANPYIDAHNLLLYVKRRDVNNPIADLFMYKLSEEEEVLIFRGSKNQTPIKANLNPKGDKIACLTRSSKELGVYLLTIDNMNLQLLKIPSLRDIPTWYPNEDKLLLTLDRWPYARFFSYDFLDSTLEEIDFLNHLNTLSPKWYKDSLYFLAMGPGHPLGVYKMDEKKTITQITPEQKITHVNGPEVIAVETEHDYKLPCLLYRPEKNQGKTILMLHGGPSGCWQAAWSPLIDRLTYLGFNVLLVNPRGSTIRNWNLPPLKKGEYGVAELEDIKSCIEYLYSKNLASKGKIGIYGHSYGSYIAISSSQKFKKDISACLITGGYLHPAVLKDSKDNAVVNFSKFAFNSSLLTHQKKTYDICPVLQIHGQNDKQLDLDSAKKTFSLLLNSPEHEFLVLAKEGHMFRYKANIEKWLRKAVKHFVKNID